MHGIPPLITWRDEMCLEDCVKSWFWTLVCLTSIANIQLTVNNIQINFRRIVWSKNVILEVIRI